MNENKEQELKRTEKQNITESFLFRLIAVAITILVIYFVMSPYQNCMKEKGSAGFCTRETGW